MTEKEDELIYFPRDKNDIRERCQFRKKGRGVWIGSLGVGDQKVRNMRRKEWWQTGQELIVNVWDGTIEDIRNKAVNFCPNQDQR